MTNAQQTAGARNGALAPADRREVDRGALVADMQRTGSFLPASFIPSSFEGIMEMAKLMSGSKNAVPAYLRGNPGACLAVTMDAYALGVSPFALAKASYVTTAEGVIQYEGKAVAAMVNARANLRGRLSLSWEGEGENLRCTCSGTFVGEDEPKSITVDMKTITVRNSPLWKQQPRIQLGYYAMRAWGRLYAPEVLLGFQTARDDGFDGETIDGEVVGTGDAPAARPRAADYDAPQRPAVRRMMAADPRDEPVHHYGAGVAADAHDRAREEAAAQAQAQQGDDPGQDDDMGFVLWADDGTQIGTPHVNPASFAAAYEAAVVQAEDVATFVENNAATVEAMAAAGHADAAARCRAAANDVLPADPAPPRQADPPPADPDPAPEPVPFSPGGKGRGRRGAAPEAAAPTVTVRNADGGVRYADAALDAAGDILLAALDLCEDGDAVAALREANGEVLSALPDHERIAILARMDAKAEQYAPARDRTVEVPMDRGAADWTAYYARCMDALRGCATPADFAAFEKANAKSLADMDKAGVKSFVRPIREAIAKGKGAG
jgi:hypothetical protein